MRAPALVTGIAYYDGDEWPVGYRGGDGIAWFRRPPPYKADWEGRTDPFVTAFETEALSAWGGGRTRLGCKVPPDRLYFCADSLA